MHFSSYFLECEETEVSLRDALKDKGPTYDSLIEIKKRRIAFIFSCQQHTSVLKGYYNW